MAPLSSGDSRWSLSLLLPAQTVYSHATKARSNLIGPYYSGDKCKPDPSDTKTRSFCLQILHSYQNQIMEFQFKKLFVGDAFSGPWNNTICLLSI